MKTSYLFFTTLFAVGLFFCGNARAGDQESQPPVRAVANPAGRVQHQYCGLYCLHAAGRLLQHPVSFDDLLQPEYIGQPHGSSLSELAEAAAEFKLNATPIAGFGAGDLAIVEPPVILHVSNELAPTDYTHWLLYLGQENGTVRIWDPKYAHQGAVEIPAGELLARSSGAALLIESGRKAPGNFPFVTRRWFRLLGYGLLIAAAVGGWRLLESKQKTSPAVLSRSTRFARLRTLSSQFVVILTISHIAALAYHVFTKVGFYRNPAAVGLVESTHFPIEIPNVTTDEMRRLLKDERVFVVDARDGGQFQREHLPGAINLPVSSSSWERRKTLSHVPYDKPLVVYCQSEACPWAEQVARLAVIDGRRGCGPLYTAVFSGFWSIFSLKDRVVAGCGVGCEFKTA